MKRNLSILFLFTILFTACSAGPFDAGKIKAQAQADQLSAQTLQESLDAEQQRAQSAQRFELEKKQKELELGRNMATEQTKRDGLNLFWQAFFLVGTGAMIFVIFHTARTTTYAMQALAEVAVEAARVRANLIYVDPKTGRFPLLREYIGHGRFTLTDPNTAYTLMLDTRNDPDRQMIDGAISIGHTYVLASAATRSENPAGVSIIEPPRQYEMVDASGYPQAGSAKARR